MERLRTSPEQFCTMVEFMEKHGDLTKIQTNDRERADRLWLDLTTTLNIMRGGVRRTTMSWKKVWAYWRAKTKKKSMLIKMSVMNGDGGPGSGLKLTALERRLLTVMSTSSPLTTTRLVFTTLPPPPIERTNTEELTNNTESILYVTDVVKEETTSMLDISETKPAVCTSSNPPSPPPADTDPLEQAPSRRRRYVGLAAIEVKRLRLEELRDKRLHEREIERDRLLHEREVEREKLLHEREMERLRVEARKLDVERTRNMLLQRCADVAQTLVEWVTLQK